MTLALINDHFLLCESLNEITEGQAESAKSQNDPENVLFKTHGSESEETPDPKSDRANRGGPNQTGKNAIAQKLEWFNTIHANHDGDNDPETIQEPVTEQDLEAVSTEKTFDRLKPFLELWSLLQKEFSIKPADGIVKPITYK
jgi:hypothetical protein